MKNSMPFDCEGEDGISNNKAFKELPSVLRLVVRETQAKIQKAVEDCNPCRVVQATSGFRSFETNRKWKGQPNSLHLFGFARDFKQDLGPGKPLAVPEWLECISSKGCWHIQVKKGF